VNITAYYYYYY